MTQVPNSDLLAKRDELLQELRREGVRGVRSAGLTRSGGAEHLLLLVAPGCGAQMPKSFDGTPIIVREASVAKA